MTHLVAIPEHSFWRDDKAAEVAMQSAAGVQYRRAQRARKRKTRR
jgi:hypothetical protein